MTLNFLPNSWMLRSRVFPGIFPALTLSLLLAAFGFTALRAQNVAYETNNINGTVGVINTSTDTVVATISGFSHPFCLAASPNGQLLYVCNVNNTVSAVSTATNSITTNISLPGALGFVGQEGAGPNVVFSPNGALAYVVTSGGGVNSTLYAINTATNTVVSSASFGATFLLGVAVSPDGNTLYIASEGSGVIVVNANTLATVTTIAPTHLLDDIAISPDGSTLYVSDVSGLAGTGSNGVLVIDTASNTVTATVPLPNNTFVTGIAVTPDGQHVYVEDFTQTRPTNSTVTVINAADDSVNTTISADGQTLTSLAITPDGSKVVATNAILSTTVDSTVAVISTATNAITDSITVGLFSAVITTTDLTPPGVTNSIAANFNGTAIPAGDDVWFSAVTKVSGLGSSPVNIFISNSTITLTANGTPITVPVPNTILTFDPNATTATTTFNVGLNQWHTVVPSSGLAGNVFLDGVPLPLPNGLPGGIKNVLWSASFATDTPGISLQWKWAAAAYSSLALNCSPDPPGASDLNCLGAKPVDDNKASQYQNSDQAGTPENSKTNVVGGATGGGGSNFTGGLSGTLSVTPKVVP